MSTVNVSDQEDGPGREGMPVPDDASAPQARALPEGESFQEDAPVSGAASVPSRLRARVFISYCHADKDSDWYADVRKYLGQLAVGSEIEVWDDTALEAGNDWNAEVESALATAMAAVFLVSAGFVKSSYITDHEIPNILQRCENDGLVVHALIGEHCDWENHDIGKFLASRQLVHSPDTTLENMEPPERHRRLNDLVKQIRKEIGAYRGRNGQERRTRLIAAVEDEMGVEVIGEAAGGDTSIIYRSLRGQQQVAVKAMVSRPISDAGQREIKAELRKCQGLRNAAFIRIFDLKFRDGFCWATADWIPGRSLKKTIRRRRAGNWRDTSSVMLKLAEAIAEGHRNGLRFLNINPDNIIMHGREPRIYPVDFSSWIASASHSQGVLSFTIESLEYLAPEHLARRAEREDALVTAQELEEREVATTKMADQYALGMVALAMMEGGPPVRVRAVADVARLLHFQSEPRRFEPDDDVPLEERDWRRAAPGLARVVWRMLEPRPEDRWDSMDIVAAQLRSLATGDSDVPTHVSEAKESYRDAVRGKDAFYLAFYRRLFQYAPELEPKFDNVNMKAQHALLDGAIERMLNYRTNQTEPTTLTGIAERHVKYDLTPADFEHFGQAFLDTLAEVAGIEKQTADAWEAVLWPAIEYMKDNAI